MIKNTFNRLVIAFIMDFSCWNLKQSKYATFDDDVAMIVR